MHATEGPNIASLTWHMIPASQAFSFTLLFQSFDIFWSNLEALRVLAQKTESLQEIYLLCLPVPTCRLLLLPPRRMVIERLIVLDHGIWSWLNDSLRNGWCLKPIEKDVWFHMIVRQCHGEKHDQHVISDMMWYGFFRVYWCKGTHTHFRTSIQFSYFVHLWSFRLCSVDPFVPPSWLRMPEFAAMGETLGVFARAAHPKLWTRHCHESWVQGRRVFPVLAQTLLQPAV